MPVLDYSSSSGRRGSRFTWVHLLVLIFIGLFLVGILLPSLNKPHNTAISVRCASNLRQIGFALLLYANDNHGKFPRTRYVPGAVVIPDVTNTGFDSPGAILDPKNMFTYNPNIPANCVPSALFLVLRTEDILPSVFVCPSSNQTPDLFGGGTNTAQNRSNFTSIATNLSYAYANPYPDDAAAKAGYDLNNHMDPGFAIAADRGPGPTANPAWLNLTATSTAAQLSAGNSPNHSTNGQSVLYADGHVEFQQTPLCGLNRDNIYVRRGNPTTLPSDVINSPRDAEDSVLLP